MVLAQQNPPVALGGRRVLLAPSLSRSSEMHMFCARVGPAAILAGAGRPEEWPLPCAGPASMTSQDGGQVQCPALAPAALGVAEPLR